MHHQGPVETLVRRARRRCLLSVAIEHGAWGASAALAALLALLLAGTQVLEWYWLLVAAAAGLAASAWRLGKRIPSPYRAARLLDRNLGAEDTISTAFYFGNLDPRGDTSREMRQAQHRAACEVARQTDVRHAVPIRVPRAAYLAIALAVSAGALFGWRYGVIRSLSLRPPLVDLAFDTFRMTPVRESSLRKTPAQRLIDEQLEKLGIPANEPAKPASANDISGEAANPTQAPDGDQAAPRDELAPPESAEQGDDAGDRSTDGDSRDPAAMDQPPSGTPSSDRQPPADDGNPMLDKLRDAMANLLAKLKIKPPPGVPTNAKGSQVGKKGPHASRSEKGGPGAGEQSMEGAQSAQAQGEQPGDPNQASRTGQGQSSTRAPQRTSTESGKSGIGRQDGDKTLRDAEQLAAMGKLSELLGRRSAEITGEIMVEVKSGKQELKTQYSQSAAAHSDAGGEVHRDEIPLLYQPYVEQYFEQVHKAPAKK